MPDIPIRDASLAVEQSGGGDVDLVLIHGFQNNRFAWDPFVERIDPDRYRVTRFDHVGCGASSRPAQWSRCTIDEYARDLAALCDALELRAPVLVGHSLGGATAIRAALNAPDRFAGLVLVAPASTTGLDFLPEGAFEGLAHPTQEQQQELARAQQRIAPT
jgi:sigma-B regulation protein RsbQ